jgi:hypothetical protein
MWPTVLQLTFGNNEKVGNKIGGSGLTLEISFCGLHVLLAIHLAYPNHPNLSV